jgi:hypothetical protein
MKKMNPYRNLKIIDENLQGQKRLLSEYLERLPEKEYRNAMSSIGFIIEDNNINKPPVDIWMEEINQIRFKELTN